MSDEAVKAIKLYHPAIILLYFILFLPVGSFLYALNIWALKDSKGNYTRMACSGRRYL